jgi:hypothetical protein
MDGPSKADHDADSDSDGEAPDDLYVLFYFDLNYFFF